MEIVSQFMPPGTSLCDDVSERHSHALFGMVHTMMSLIELPLSFMGYALETTAFTLNRAPRISVEMTQYRLRFREI